MKKVFFSLLLLQILILTGCQSFMDKEIPEAEVAEMPVDLLHQHAVDEISVEQDGNIYTIYLYSPDEADSNSDFGTYGHYELYVAQEESELATFQNTGYFLFHNMEKDTSYLKSLSINEHVLLQIDYPQSTYLFDLQEDTLRSLIQADDTEFKIYQDSIIQTITYNDADKRYLYTTYTFDDNSKTLKQIDEHPFTPNANNEKDEQEKAWKEEDWNDERYHFWNWQTFDDAIIPYVERDALASWELPATIVKDAEEGSVEGVPAHLGDDMWDVFQENKTIYDEYWLREDFFKLYGDDELAYKERRIDYGNYIIGYQPTDTFDEATEDAKKRYTGKITSITIPASRTTITQDDIENGIDDKQAEKTTYTTDVVDQGIRYFAGDDVVLDFLQEKETNGMTISLRHYEESE